MEFRIDLILNSLAGPLLEKLSSAWEELADKEELLTEESRQEFLDCTKRACSQLMETMRNFLLHATSDTALSVASEKLDAARNEAIATCKSFCRDYAGLVNSLPLNKRPKDHIRADVRAKMDRAFVQIKASLDALLECIASFTKLWLETRYGK